MKRLNLGITGSMGSGKSTVCRLIHDLAGWPVYNADEQAKQMLLEPGQVKDGILKLFGLSAYLPDGQVNRAHLSALIFNDPALREQMNAIVHPASIMRYKAWLMAQDAPITLKEAALLLEATSWQELDAIIVVTAPETIRIKRVLQRDPYRTEDQIKKIFAAQLPEEEKVAKSNHIIVNDGNTPLLPQVNALVSSLNGSLL